MSHKPSRMTSQPGVLGPGNTSPKQATEMYDERAFNLIQEGKIHFQTQNLFTTLSPIGIDYGATNTDRRYTNYSEYSHPHGKLTDFLVFCVGSSSRFGYGNNLR